MSGRQCQNQSVAAGMETAVVYSLAVVQGENNRLAWPPTSLLVNPRCLCVKCAASSLSGLSEGQQKQWAQISHLSVELTASRQPPELHVSRKI